MTYTYKTKGTCSREIHVELKPDGTIADVAFKGGCNGNLKGVSTLVKGLRAEDVIGRLRGTECEGKGTSCPDQLSIALELALEELQNAG
ncbi:TIGR03905 family TSCPD domain-containing protein [Oscillospiraceae bacterium OttesenSCG-928-F05]|nr:TIGR03905 family TSCPD domain-containing protein [Oscillospiraceae bacterium OttesenSCG-928-F05]